MAAKRTRRTGRNWSNDVWTCKDTCIDCESQVICVETINHLEGELSYRYLQMKDSKSDLPASVKKLFCRQSMHCLNLTPLPVFSSTLALQTMSDKESFSDASLPQCVRQVEFIVSGLNLAEED